MACVRPRDRALIEFLYATGVRVSELCSLNVGDIDLYKQEFKVMGKGRKERHLYISDAACFHLYRYLRWRMSREGLTMEELANKPLFVSAKKPYTRMTVAGVQYLVDSWQKGRRWKRSSAPVPSDFCHGPSKPRNENRGGYGVDGAYQD